MPEENSIFMKTSSRALGILTQLHSETAQAMYAAGSKRNGSQQCNPCGKADWLLPGDSLSAGFSPCKEEHRAHHAG